MEPVVPFNPHRFRVAARHYHGRPQYAPRLFSWIARECGAGPDDRVLDLGCGPANVAIGMAPYAGLVTAIDPEPEMLARASAAIADAGLLDRISLVQGSSADIDERMGTFGLVTMGRSFHWMDRREMLRRLDRMLRPGAAVVLIDSLLPQGGWHRQYRGIMVQHAGPEAAGWRGPGWVEHEDILLTSEFSHLSRIAVVETHRMPAGALVDRAFSTSRAAPDKLGPERSAALARDLSALAAQIAVDGIITERVESTALIARRP